MRLRAFLFVVALVGLGAATPVACGRIHAVDQNEVARPIVDVEAPPAATDAAAPTEASSPGVVKLHLLDDPGFVVNAVPFHAPTRDHAGGTLAIATQAGIYEIDIETGATLRRAAPPVTAATYRIAATPSGVIATWRHNETHVAVFDGSLALIATHALASGTDPGVSADGDLAVVAHSSSAGGSPRFELARFELSTGRKLSSQRFTGQVGTIRENGAHVVAQHGRIYALSTEPRPELQVYDHKLTRVRVVPLPWHPAIPGLLPNAASLSAAGAELIVTLGNQAMTVEPTSGAVRARPELLSNTWSDSVAVDSDGRVLLDTGYLAESVDGPFEKRAELGSKLWKLSSWDEPMYVDSPVSAFFWGGRAVLVTKFPNVSLIRIDVGRK
ncbi:MAG: hypothetical protein IPI67_27870 [Myxococcales bacterium]|nr:hypothetical protein [Myxococcales bacterium]